MGSFFVILSNIVRNGTFTFTPIKALFVLINALKRKKEKEAILLKPFTTHERCTKTKKLDEM